MTEGNTPLKHLGSSTMRLMYWNFWSRETHCASTASQCLVKQKWVSSRRLPGCVAIATPRVTPCFGLAKRLTMLTPHLCSLRKLVLPESFQENLLVVLQQLHCFPLLEELELNRADISRLKWTALLTNEMDETMPFCDFAKLKRLILDEVKVDSLFFVWLAKAVNLQCLVLRDLIYDGSLDALQQLTGLRKLEVTGYVDLACDVIRFSTSFKQLEELVLEIGSRDEAILRLLSKSLSRIHLKLRRCYHPRQLGAICAIQNLHSLLISTPFRFTIPRQFKSLQKLHTLTFIDENNAFNELSGFENVPISVKHLNLDLNSPKHTILTRILTGLHDQLSSLSLRQRIMCNGLGLDQILSLESLELCGKKEFDDDVFDKVEVLTQLKHLTVEGCPHIENRLASLVEKLDLQSLSIANAYLTDSGLETLSQLSNLKTLTLRYCTIIVPDIDCFTSFPSLNSLTLVNPMGMDHLLFELTSYLKNGYLKSFELTL
eukprot:g7885.t1